MEEPTTPRDGHSTTGHFRESDIEFLMGQATEWLEAVLGEDLDDQTSLEDLLADGAVLYRVAQHIREDSSFPGHGESGPHSPLGSPAMERRSSLKYQPYASVEAFLKVCKEVGLQDLDLFNPSDAVDKKDVRRVCVCLRRLSKKGRTLGIRVPDFDNVKDTLVTPASRMPREAVRRTQESLQQSSSRSSRSGSANGLVSSETSSLIGDLRKDDAQFDQSEAWSKMIGGHNEEDAKTRKAKPLVSIRSGVDSTHGPAPRAAHLLSPAHTSHERDSDGNGGGTNTAADPLIKPFQGLVVDKRKGHSSDASVEEKSNVQPSDEKRKGLFTAHLQGKEPYVKKKESKKDEKPDEGYLWLSLLGGALAMAGVAAGLLFLKTRSAGDDNVDDEGQNLHSGGLYEVRSGDNLTKIAKTSGRKNWHEVADKNPSLDNPHLIYPGDRLRL